MKTDNKEQEITDNFEEIKLVAFIFLAVFAYNILVIGTVGTLLGFVLGYYFKSEEKS